MEYNIQVMFIYVSDLFIFQLFSTNRIMFPQIVNGSYATKY